MMPDCQHEWKLAVDAAFEYLGIDDCLIDDLHLVRQDPDRPSGRIVLEIREAPC